MSLWRLLVDHSCSDDPLYTSGQRRRDSPILHLTNTHWLLCNKTWQPQGGGTHMRHRTKEGQRSHVRCPNHFYWKKTTCDGIHQAEVNLPAQLLARGAEPDSCNVQRLSLYHLQTNRWYSIREQVWPLAVTLADRRLKGCFGLDYAEKYRAQLFGCRGKMMRWKCAAAL